MFGGQGNELVEGECIISFQKLFFEHVDSEFVEVESHVGYHPLILLFDAFVSCARRVYRVNVQRIFTQSDRHSKFYYRISNQPECYYDQL